MHICLYEVYADAIHYYSGMSYEIIHSPSFLLLEMLRGLADPLGTLLCS